MDEQTTTSNKVLTCLECKNETELGELKEGDVTECEHCGIEYEVKGVTDNEYSLEIIEEEK